MGGLPSVLRGHTKWVADHEASTVGDGVGQSNDSFTYNKNLTQISVWVFFSLDKKRIIVYTNSVVNREDYINVVANFDMLTHAAPDEVSDSIKELLTRVVWG